MPTDHLWLTLVTLGLQTVAILISINRLARETRISVETRLESLDKDLAVLAQWAKNHEEFCTERHRRHLETETELWQELKEYYKKGVHS